MNMKVVVMFFLLFDSYLNMFIYILCFICYILYVEIVVVYCIFIICKVFGEGIYFVCFDKLDMEFMD